MSDILDVYLSKFKLTFSIKKLWIHLFNSYDSKSFLCKPVLSRCSPMQGQAYTRLLAGRTQAAWFKNERKAKIKFAWATLQYGGQTPKDWSEGRSGWSGQTLQGGAWAMGNWAWLGPVQQGGFGNLPGAIPTQSDSQCKTSFKPRGGAALSYQTGQARGRHAA